MAKKVYAVIGPANSGKTTAAKALAERLNAALVIGDITQAAMRRGSRPVVIDDYAPTTPPAEGVRCITVAQARAMAGMR